MRRGSERQFDEEPFGRQGEGVQDVEALLSSGRDDGSQTREVDGAARRSEAAGYFDLHLHHPQVLFGQVVGEGRFEIVEEP